MSVHAVVVDLLLAVGALNALACSIGVAVARGCYTRLHYVGPLAIASPTTITLALVVDGAAIAVVAKMVLVTLVLIVAGTVLTHATARAERVRRYGHWAAQPGERVESLPSREAA